MPLTPTGKIMKIKLPSGLPFCGDLSRQTSPNPSLFEAQTPPEQPELRMNASAPNGFLTSALWCHQEGGFDIICWKMTW